MLSVSDYINSVPDKYDSTFECHSVSRALARHITGLTAVDGYYLGAVPELVGGEICFSLMQISHSWLVTPDGTIIDSYPVGLIAANAIAIPSTGKYAPFGKGFYIRDDSVTAKIMNRTVYRRSQVLFDFIQIAEKTSRRKPLLS